MKGFCFHLSCMCSIELNVSPPRITRRGRKMLPNLVEKARFQKKQFHLDKANINGSPAEFETISCHLFDTGCRHSEGITAIWWRQRVFEGK